MADTRNYQLADQQELVVAEAPSRYSRKPRTVMHFGLRIKEASHTFTLTLETGTALEKFIAAAIKKAKAHDGHRRN